MSKEEIIKNWFDCPIYADEDDQYYIDRKADFEADLTAFEQSTKDECAEVVENLKGCFIELNNWETYADESMPKFTKYTNHEKVIQAIKSAGR